MSGNSHRPHGGGLWPTARTGGLNLVLIVLCAIQCLYAVTPVQDGKVYSRPPDGPDSEDGRERDQLEEMKKLMEPERMANLMDEVENEYQSYNYDSDEEEASKLLDELGISAETNDIIRDMRDLWERLKPSLERGDIDDKGKALRKAPENVNWAEEMTQLRLGEDGVENEVLPYITVRAGLKLKPPPDGNDLAALRREHQKGLLRVDVLENQLVIVSGAHTKTERKQMENSYFADDDVQPDLDSLRVNVLASRLACRRITGTAMLMLVGRVAVPGQPQLHELAFFDKHLWESWESYINYARMSADFYDGDEKFEMRMHWRVLAKAQRKPFVLRSANLSVVAQPRLVPHLDYNPEIQKTCDGMHENAAGDKARAADFFSSGAR